MGVFDVREWQAVMFYKGILSSFCKRRQKGKMVDKAGLKGVVKWRLVGEDGVEKAGGKNNLIVDAGLSQLAVIIADQTGPFSHVACGTNSTIADASQVALGTEIARTALTDITPSGATVEYEGNFPAGTGTGTIQELGILMQLPVGRCWLGL